MMWWFQLQIDRWRVGRLLRRDGWVQRGMYWEKP